MIAKQVWESKPVAFAGHLDEGITLEDWLDGKIDEQYAACGGKSTGLWKPSERTRAFYLQCIQLARSRTDAKESWLLDFAPGRDKQKPRFASGLVRGCQFEHPRYFLLMLLLRLEQKLDKKVVGGGIMVSNVLQNGTPVRGSFQFTIRHGLKACLLVNARLDSRSWLPTHPSEKKSQRGGVKLLSSLELFSALESRQYQSTCGSSHALDPSQPLYRPATTSRTWTPCICYSLIECTCLISRHNVNAESAAW